MDRSRFAVQQPSPRVPDHDARCDPRQQQSSGQEAGDPGATVEEERDRQPDSVFQHHGADGPNTGPAKALPEELVIDKPAIAIKAMPHRGWILEQIPISEAKPELVS